MLEDRELGQGGEPERNDQDENNAGAGQNEPSADMGEGKPFEDSPPPPPFDFEINWGGDPSAKWNRPDPPHLVNTSSRDKFPGESKLNKEIREIYYNTSLSFGEKLRLKIELGGKISSIIRQIEALISEDSGLQTLTQEEKDQAKAFIELLQTQLTKLFVDGNTSSDNPPEQPE